MRLYELLLESVSYDSTIKSIVADIGYPITSVYDQMKNLASRYIESHGNLGKGFGLVKAGPGARWFEKHYINKLQTELYNLCKYRPKQTEKLKSYLRTHPRNFGDISANLPEILINVGISLNSKELISAAKFLRSARDDYDSFIANLQIDNDEDIEDIENSEKKDHIADQNKQVEDLVNHILSSVPNKIAGDIRNSISKAGNKLQALRSELLKRNIKI